MRHSREEILTRIRLALGRKAPIASPVYRPAIKVPPRRRGGEAEELEALLSEIEKLGGRTRCIDRDSALADALRELVVLENIRKATLWATPDLRALNLEEQLRLLGVEIVSADEDKQRLAECDLGITGVDAALPETGTLLLRSSAERPRLVSLLPRAHLAILRPTALRGDLDEVFADARDNGCFVLVTGPSRTSDIELTLTIGVHGPKALYVWLLTEEKVS